MRRLLLLSAPAFGLTGLVFVLGVGVPWLLTSQPNPVTEQPIHFDHRIHAEVARIDCAFCHRTATQGVTAGYPDLQQCMFCHQVVGQGLPEVDKVRQAWVQQQPIDWARVHRLPDHTRFDHAAHLRAGLPCATCHGSVSQMSQVTQVRSLRMSDCVNCHRQMNAPAECGACHY
jgi:hypothetical protein